MATKAKYVGPPGQRIQGLAPTPGEELELDAAQAKALAGHRWFELWSRDWSS
jgi:hypothetical protein